MATTDPSTPAAPPPISKLWWVLTAVAFVLAFGLGIGGCASFINQNTPDDQSVVVPGEGVVTVEEAGDFSIQYQSNQFLDTGVCRNETESGASGTDTTSTVCEPDLLAAAGEPTLRRPGEDRIRLARDTPSLLRINDEITLDVWQVTLEPGEYELGLADAPLGTERLVFESQEVNLGPVLIVLLSVPVFLGAVVLLIVSLVRSSSRKRRRGQAAYPQAQGAPQAWGTPGGGTPGWNTPPPYGQQPYPTTPAPPPGWVAAPPNPPAWPSPGEAPGSAPGSMTPPTADPPP